MGWHDRVPCLVFRVRVVVAVNWVVQGGGRPAHAQGDAAEGLAWAEEAVGGRFVADLFALDSILLVVKLQEGKLNGGLIRVIQRFHEGVVDGSVDGEVEVLEEERL